MKLVMKLPWDKLCIQTVDKPSLIKTVNALCVQYT